MSEIRRTPLFKAHETLGAKFVPFAGWEMPVLYSGVIEEHHAVRNGVGIFDVSHMGEIFVSGDGALQYLQSITCNDVSKLVPGRAQYSVLMTPVGGAVDDIIIYRFENEYLVCVNAANIEKDYHWMVSHRAFDAKIENRSSEFSQIAVQGPLAWKVVEQIYGEGEGSCSLERFPMFSFQELGLPGTGVQTIVARTGYTGEDGFEIFIPNSDAVFLWDTLLEVGAEYGPKPCGLGARDTLRLEACLPLYGHELNDDLNILSANLGWVVKLDKGEFIGREALRSAKSDGTPWKLIGVEVVDAGIIREGVRIFDDGGNDIGWVTSGTKTPTVNKSIGLCYVTAKNAEVGCSLWAEVRGRKLRVEVVTTPFYKRAK